MDSYLAIAQTVLKDARRPLGAREILTCAYQADMVPEQLYGKTQHKTLGARISEDILLNRDRSAFFRTEPGKFFLRELMADETLPVEFRTPIIARRRRRELPQGRPLIISFDALHLETTGTAQASEILQTLGRRSHYSDTLKTRLPGDVVVWSFVIVTRDSSILTYRHGRYRADRDSFYRRRSLGFFTPVVDSDASLFDRGDLGIVTSAIKTIALDLDLPADPGVSGGYDALAAIKCFVLDEKAIADGANLLAVVRFECPTWFEPLRRRLAINDLQWQDMSRPLNHLEDFDPWSQLVLNQAQQLILMN